MKVAARIDEVRGLMMIMYQVVIVYLETEKCRLKNRNLKFKIQFLTFQTILRISDL